MDDKRQRILSAIASYLPETVVARCIATPDQPDVSGAFATGTFVFADVSGFTAMSEKLSVLGKEGAEELTGILNRYFTRMLDIVNGYGGSLIKFGGDAMFILYSGQHRERRAVRSALLMQREMSAFSRIPTSQGVFTLRMSVGVKSGEYFELHGGVPGERRFPLFTGPAVNETARIEGAAEAGEVLVDPVTFKALETSAVTAGEKPEGTLVSELRGRVARAPLQVPAAPPAVIDRVIEKLGDYLPKALVKRLHADPDAPGVAEEHRRVTVMFVNLLDPTAVIERYGREDPAAATDILNRYLAMLQGTVAGYGGLVIGADLNAKGDKLLVLFGTPVAHEDDDERAVRCAVELNERLRAAGLPLSQRIGINSGYVFSGEVGSPRRKEFTVMGDNVNLGARVMGVAGEGEIIVTRAVRDKAAAAIDTESLPPVKVKGKEKPVPIFRVAGVKQAEHRARSGTEAPLTGRIREMALVDRLIREARAGKGQTVAFVGVAGIGKSRLVLEAGERWRSAGGTLYRGSCYSFAAGTPYLPWIEILMQCFGIHEDDEPAARQRKTESAVAAIKPSLREWTALLGGLLNVPVPESPVLKSLDPKMRRQRLHDVILEILQECSARNPLMLDIQDLQWSDRSSLELLHYVMRNTRNHALFTALAFRPDERPDLVFPAEERYHELLLAELSRDESLRMATALAALAEPSPEMEELIAVKAQGNPLYVEEIVKSLKDGGFLEPDAGGRYRLRGRLDEIDIPDTIQGVIMSRLDRLDDATHELVKVASVAGRLFRLDVTRALYAGRASEAELRGRLDRLVELDVIAPAEEGPVPEYVFRHIMTQEVAYESLLYAQRREYHHRIGEFYEEAFPGQLEEHLELLCYHYRQTKDVEKALEFSVKAGDKAKRLFTNHDAIEYYRAALDLTGHRVAASARLRAKVAEDLADTYELTGEYEAALESLAACRQFYDGTAPGPVKRSRRIVRLEARFDDLPSARQRDRHLSIIHLKTALVMERKGKYEEALGWLGRGVEVLGKVCPEHARLYTARAGVHYRRGEHAEGMRWCRMALEVAEGFGLDDETAHGYYLLGTIHTDTGDTAKAIRFRRHSLKLYERSGNLPGQARVHNNLGVDYYYQGKWELAKRHYQKSGELREKTGDINGTATVSNNLGELLYDQGYFVQAERAFRQCLEIWERIGYRLGVGLANSNLGRTYSKQGKAALAVEHLKESLAIFEQLSSQSFTAEVHQRFAEHYLESGDTKRALASTRRAQAAAGGRNLVLVDAVSHRLMGRIRSAEGKPAEAAAELERSTLLLRKQKASFELALSLWYLAELPAGGKGLAADRRRKLRDEAVRIFTRLNIQPARYGGHKG